MESDDGFEAFGKEIKSDPLGVLLAKWQRDAFTARLKRLPDVIEVIPSGSLARETHIGLVRDVDLIVVFDESAHPDYGSGSESARDAMTYLENRLLEQLHPLSGSDALLTGVQQRTHVVKCHGGSAGPYAEFIPSAPPVDVMPAVRGKPHLLERSPLLVPELAAQGESKWVDVDPETFMRQVEQRQREWKYFTEVIRAVRAWAEHEHLDMKTVAIEAMVLMYCPRPRMFETLSRGEAVARFFKAASKAHISVLNDPAGRRGEIDGDMRYGKLRSALDRAAGLSRQAMDAEYAWKERLQAGEAVTHPDVFWRQLFGKAYPKAKERFWRPPVFEPWFGKYRFEPATEFVPGDLSSDRPDGRWHPPTDNPNPPPDGGWHPPKDDPNPPPDGRWPKPPRRDNPEKPDDLGQAWRRDRPAPRPGGDFGWQGDAHAGRTERRSPAAAASPGAASASPGRHAGSTSAGAGTNLWTGVFGSAAATVSVPLTFG